MRGIVVKIIDTLYALSYFQMLLVCIQASPRYWKPGVALAEVYKAPVFSADIENVQKVKKVATLL